MQPCSSTPRSVLEDRRKLDFAKELVASGWYHSMNFPDGEVIEGYMSLAVQEERYRDFRLPGDLSGRRTLDIGAWDGWFSFEMERHGAAVTAVDLVEVKNFLYAHRRLQSSVTYLVSDVMSFQSRTWPRLTLFYSSACCTT